MNAVKCILFVIILALTQQVRARAELLEGTNDCPLIKQLIEFVAGETVYPPLQICPRVNLSTEAELRSMFIEASAHGEEPLAAFLPANGEILLSPEIDLKSILGRSYLVHEIVHAAQFNSGDNASESCIGLLEIEAYRVQASYLKKHDLAEEAIVFVWMSVMHIGACTHYGYYN